MIVRSRPLVLFRNVGRHSTLAAAAVTTENTSAYFRQHPADVPTLMRNPNLSNEVHYVEAVGGGDDWLVGERPAQWWTGKAPVSGLCPGVGKDGALSSLPLIQTAYDREGLQEYFDNTWAMTEVRIFCLSMPLWGWGGRGNNCGVGQHASKLERATACGVGRSSQH